MYVCGITPYDATHMGHAATYVTFDLLGRALRDAGHDGATTSRTSPTSTTRCSSGPSATGVDWQRPRRARDRAVPRGHDRAARSSPPDHYVGVGRGIPTGRRGRRRAARQGRGLPRRAARTSRAAADVYFDLSAEPGFGAVSVWTREQMLEVFAERGGDPDRAGKRDPLDPLLWRAHRDGEPSWDGGSSATGARAGTSSAPRSRCDHLGHGLRRPGRRHRPGLPAPRDERRRRRRR